MAGLKVEIDNANCAQPGAFAGFEVNGGFQRQIVLPTPPALGTNERVTRVYRVRRAGRPVRPSRTQARSAVVGAR